LAEQAIFLERLIQKAKDEVNAGHFDSALSTLSHACHAYPGDLRAWQFAADLACHIRNWSSLNAVGRGWTQHHPSSVDAWKALSRSYFEESRFEPAIAAFAHVIDLEPDNVGHLVSAARMATAAQFNDSALAYLNAAEALSPQAGEVLYAKARLYQLSGELSLAEDYCRRAIHALPGFVPAYTMLGLLTEGALSDAEIATATQLAMAPGLHAEYRAMINFTLGDALDHKGDYPAAFAAWERANHINSQISAQEGYVYDPAQHDADVPLIAQLFSNLGNLGDGGTGLGASDGDGDTGHGDGGTGHGGLGDGDNPRPIFVVGMPRSGTTLIESILASHSEVHGAGELPALVVIYDELMNVARKQGVNAARELIGGSIDRWRQRYLQALGTEAARVAGVGTEAEPGGQIKHVVDKQPLNYRCIGLIRLLFPQSPIIYTRRAAKDVALSIFRHNFSKNWPCAHNINHIAHYYGVHTRMMNLWEQQDPTSFHIVDHAALVADPDTEIRRLLSFARLEVQAACLSPHKTKRRVATFSAVQVQKPVSSRYSGRSANYADFLKGLTGEA